MTTRSILTGALFMFALSSCDKDNDSVGVKPYTVPTTYTFSNVNFKSSYSRNQMAEELRVYLNTAHAGTAVTPLDAAKINNMWSNTGSPFANAALNTSGTNIKDLTSNAALIKLLVDSMVLYNTATSAVQGTGGWIPRGNNKIIIGPRGLEYIQGYAKGTMSSLFFKEAIRLLSEVKTVPVLDTIKAQGLWDEIFGNLAIPVTYDSTIAYAAEPDKPFMWGGYLRERGRPIQAGGTLFSALLKGRAAIGGYDVATRDAQADIIIAKWEQLAARSALVYVNMPTQSNNVGNLAAQFHALSEAYGFLMALQYRHSSSKLTPANFETLKTIINKDFYVLVNQPGFADLVTAQNILKTTYNIEP